MLPYLRYTLMPIGLITKMVCGFITEHPMRQIS